MYTGICSIGKNVVSVHPYCQHRIMVFIWLNHHSMRSPPCLALCWWTPTMHFTQDHCRHALHPGLQVRVWGVCEIYIQAPSCLKFYIKILMDADFNCTKGISYLYNQCNSCSVFLLCLPKSFTRDWDCLYIQSISSTTLAEPKMW